MELQYGYPCTQLQNTPLVMHWIPQVSVLVFECLRAASGGLKMIKIQTITFGFK